MADGSRKHPYANALNTAGTKQAKAMGFASVLTVGNGAALKGKKRHHKGKGKKRVGVAVVSTGWASSPTCL